MSQSYDLVLTGGTLKEPASGVDEVSDVAILDGRIAAMGPGLAASARQTIDCSGQFVTPGLVDSHTHCFANVSKVGAPVDEAHLRRGVVAAADAGTAGASTFAAFKSYVVNQSQMRVLSFLNVSVLGLIDFRFGELINPKTFVPEDIYATAAAYPETVRGIKIRLSTDVVGHDREECLALLDRAVETGGQANLPVMVHIGETPAALEEILVRLRPGDVVAHCYTGKEEGILSEAGKLKDGVSAARDRGVIFECAHGRSNFSYAVAGPAIEQGFLPDLVCSDTSYRNWNGPVFDLMTTMSKLIALGMSFDDVLVRATVEPAKFLGLWADGYGRLEVGGPAHLSVFTWCEADDELPDAAGGSIMARRLEPKLAVVAGEVVTSLPWRGEVPSTN